jgi:hypothetical protein
MALGDLFELARLTIAGYKDATRQEPPLGELTAQYNPETLSMHHESVFQQRAGGLAGEGEWSYSQPRRLAVNLIFDGTRVGYMGVERLGKLPSVAEQIRKFLAVCYQVEGKIHEPLYLKLRWGKALHGFAAFGDEPEPAFNCRLHSASVNYKAFDRDGAPLHAELAAVFVEQLDPPKAAAELKLSSPDLTHRRVVVAGDTLPLLCRDIYGSPVHYLRVAQVNGLDDFRSLVPGQELIFPPFERARKG